MGIFLLSTLRCSLKTLPPRFLHHLLTLISVGIFFYFGKALFCAPVVPQLRSRCSAIEWSLCVAILPFLFSISEVF